MFRWIDLDEKKKNYDLLLEYARRGKLDIFEVNKKYISEEYFTQEFFDVLVDKKPKYISVVPDKFITEKMLTNIVVENGKLLEYIPVEKRAKKICDIAFAQSKRNIKFFPEELVTNELAESVINEDGYLLGVLPESVLTYELYLKAVSDKGTAIKFVPKKFRIYELCKAAVLNDARAIKDVPVKFITKKFCEETLNVMDILPASTKNFVDKCLSINDNVTLQKIELKTVDFVKPGGGYSYETIRINDTELFSDEAKRFLNTLGILTLKDLFLKSKETNFIIELKQKPFYDHVIGTIKLLKCKYLNEDPLVDLASLEYNDWGIKLGLSPRAANALGRVHVSGKDLVDIMTSLDIDKGLGRIRNLGQASTNEIISKYYIVTEYYKNKVSKEPDLMDLVNELQSLAKQNAEITNKIIAIAEQIKEVQNKQAKGGSLT